MTTSVMTASAEEILAATAHEFRLPLSHIHGFVSRLRRTDVQWDEQTRRELVHISGEGWAYAAMQRRPAPADRGHRYRSMRPARHVALAPHVRLSQISRPHAGGISNDDRITDKS